MMLKTTALLIYVIQGHHGGMRVCVLMVRDVAACTGSPATVKATPGKDGTAQYQSEDD